MVTIHTTYDGELRCSSTHGPSGRELATDAPVDNHGRGESFSPTDLVATAVGSCMLTVMGIRAEREGWDLSGSRAEVVKHMSTDLPRRIARVEVKLEMAGSHDDAARATLEATARGCPVVRSLDPALEVVLTFHWAQAVRD